MQKITEKLTINVLDAVEMPYSVELRPNSVAENSDPDSKIGKFYYVF